ncbi:MAG: hypothetical protein NZ534_12610, partial [Bacteroidia bacterium]|nr:hypothetical protein [Bacteroidia bacterium]
DVPKIAENAVYHAFTNLLPSHLQKLFRIEGAHVALRKNFKYLGLFDPNGSMLEKGKPCITICTGLWAKFDGPNYVFEPPHEPPRTLIHEFAHLGDYALGRRDYLRDKTGPMWISMRDGPLKQAIMEDIANARGRAKQRLDRITSVYGPDWRMQHQEVLAVAFEEAYYEKRKRMSFPRAFRVFDQMLRQLVEHEERQAAGKAIIKVNPYHDERGRFTFAPASRRTQTDEELIDRLRDNPHRPTALVSVLTRLATLAVTDPDEGDRFLRQMVEKLGGPERRSSATHEVLRAMPAATHDQKILTAVADAYVRLRKSQRKWPPKVVDESIDPILMYASNEEEAAIGIQNYVGVHYTRQYQHYRLLLAAGAEE